MTKNEIIIGGWYLLDGKPIKAEGYSRGNVFYHTGYECGLYELEPIPLTEDILMANGFERQDYKLFRLWDENDRCILTLRYNSISFFILFHEGKGIEMNYVHELQYVLHRCGLTELADNFKIKADDN